MFERSGVGVAFRDEWPRLVSVLVRDFGDLDLAEEAAQDAFLAAAEHWPADGAPQSPSAWLLTTGRRKAIDRIRRDARFAQYAEAVQADEDPPTSNDQALVDEQLALLSGCCHPALSEDAQVALTLRIVAGLSTDQIARAFLVSPSTMTRRLSRAKAKIRAARIPFSTPSREVLVDRMAAVRRVIYLVFTEGHTSTSSAALVRGDLCDEAVWLAELVAHLVPTDPEVRGLAALVVLIDARRPSRSVDDKEVLLADQDRSLWDEEAIERGLAHLAAAHAQRSLGPFQIQAAIAAVHASAEDFDKTNWPRIVRLYDALWRREPTPIVALNRAVAVSYVDGAAAALLLIEPLAASEELQTYPYFHSTRAELLASAGNLCEATAAYDTAIGLCTNTAQASRLKLRRTELVAQHDLASVDVNHPPETEQRKSPS